MRIGIDPIFSTEVFTTSIKKKMDEMDVDIQMVEAELEQYFDADFDAVAIPMHLLARGIPGDFKIAALLPLGERSYSLLIHNEDVDASNRIGISHGMTILHPPGFVGNQLLSIESSLILAENSNKATLTSLKNRKKGSFIAESCYLTNEIKENYRVIELNPREFGHGAGQGYMALMLNSNSSYMKMVRRWNERSIIAISNIERECMNKFGFQANVHCEQDQSGNYLLWLMTKSETVHISQSTRNEIVDRIIMKLEKVK